MPMEVRNGKHDYFMGVDPIQQSIREAVHHAAPDIRPDDRPALGILGEGGEGRCNLQKEFPAEPRHLEFVVGGGIKHLLLGRPYDPNTLHLNCA